MTLRIRPVLFLLFIAVNVAAVTGYFSLVRKAGGPVRVHVEEGKAVHAASVAELRLPEMSLVDATSKTVTRADFEGRPWVLDFIYTDCPAQCPMMSTKMSALRKALPESVGFASITVNPEKDSPAVLSEYASRFGADAAHWRFLTGRKEEIEKILAALGAPSVAAADAHSVRFYLIDAKGRLAGLYDTTDDGALKNLSQDARQLAGEGNG